MEIIEGCEKPLSKNQIDYLLTQMVIVIDSREQVNHWITDYFDLKLIPYESKKLSFGDYTAVLPKCEEYGIEEDICFADKIAIERKNGLDELCNNLSKDRDRFERELDRSRGAKFILMIEDSSYEKIINHSYSSEFKPQSFVATLATYRSRYNINVDFVSKKYAGNFIYHLLKYEVREWLKAR